RSSDLRRAHRRDRHRNLPGYSPDPADHCDQRDRWHDHRTGELLSLFIEGLFMRTMRKLFDSRGTSTLEFVVVLPVLLFVLFSIVEVSRAWLTLNLATAAAREGVRAGVAAARVSSSCRYSSSSSSRSWR